MAVRQELVKNGRELPRLERYELVDKINEFVLLRDQALVAFLFLTGCRIKEVVRFLDEKDGRKLLGMPIQKKQVEERPDHLIITGVRTLKRGRTMRIRRSIPVPLNDKERPFVNVLLAYLSTLDRDSYLFDMTRQRANQILERVGLFPHYLRHLRATRLVTDYDFSNQDLQRYFGWAHSSRADTYVHLNVGDLLAKMGKFR